MARLTHFDSAPPLTIDAGARYLAQVTTDAGALVVELDAAGSPQTVNNFVFLAGHEYYDGTVFHRVIQRFMVQGGDPTGTGRGGPGYTVPDELPAGPRPYEIGSIAMANTGRPHTGGSQFFIVTGPAGVNLPPSYSRFGAVVEGMDVVHAISLDGAPPNDSAGKPAKLHRIETVRIDSRPSSS